MALETAVAAGASLYGYNRENFMYDRKMRQETEYNVMDFRLKQAELYRDDVRELIELTSVKMDTYLIVIAVELGFGVMALCEGRMKIGTPKWLLGAYILSLGSCFMYLLMAIWFAVRASVASKMYKIRLLTQHVRLPMPSWSSLEGARTYASSFEGVQNKQMFRVPFAMGLQQDLVKPRTPVAENTRSQFEESQNCQSADCWGLEGRGDHIYELDARNWTSPDNLQHLSYVRRAVPRWQSYDGFARAAMSVGTINLVHALAYYVLGYVLLDAHSVFAAWFVVVILMAIVIQIIELDMSLDRFEFFVAVLLVVLGPTIEGFACERHMVNGFADSSTVLGVTPIACLAHALFNIFMLFICKVDEQTRGGQATYLPIGFRSVMYIDVFGWINRSRSNRTSSARDFLTSPSSDGFSFSTPAAATKQEKQETSHSPAFGAVRYERGEPIQSRPEELRGAALVLDYDNLRDEHLDNASFVPPEKHDEEQLLTQEDNSGKTPWRIFSGTTLLLAIMWLLVGGGELAESLGIKMFVVQELLESPEDASEQIEEGEEIIGFQTKLHGAPIMTSWPRGAGSPHSLACGVDYNGQRVWFLASSEFRMFAAQVPTNASSQDSELRFQATSSCKGIQGRGIQDVSLQCEPLGSCRVLLLPKHSKHLATCELPASDTMSGAFDAYLSSKHRKRHKDAISDVSSTGVVRLGERAAALENEEIASLAATGLCESERGGENKNATCAYVATKSGRVFELQAGEGLLPDAKGVRSWHPVRSLRLEAVRSGDMYQKVSLIVMGNRLLVFRPSGGLVRVLDTLSQARGDRRHQGLQLPEGHRWSAACGVGDHLYVVEGGTLPSLWRFALPQEPSRKSGMLELAVSETSPREAAARPQPLGAKQGHAVASEASGVRRFRGASPISLLSVESPALPTAAS